jgi:hypothetical protein
VGRRYLEARFLGELRVRELRAELRARACVRARVRAHTCEGVCARVCVCVCVCARARVLTAAHAAWCWRKRSSTTLLYLSSWAGA